MVVEGYPVFALTAGRRKMRSWLGVFSVACTACLLNWAGFLLVENYPSAASIGGRISTVCGHLRFKLLLWKHIQPLTEYAAAFLLFAATLFAALGVSATHASKKRSERGW